MVYLLLNILPDMGSSFTPSLLWALGVRDGGDNPQHEAIRVQTLGPNEHGPWSAYNSDADWQKPSTLFIRPGQSVLESRYY